MARNYLLCCVEYLKPVTILTQFPNFVLAVSEALECGSLLPLWLKPACWRGIDPSAEILASKLAGRKAAASCRTPKQETADLKVGATRLDSRFRGND
jgi:hypothetical protein